MDMLYTAMTKKAMQLAFDVHKDQKDKDGLPYIYHPFHLAEQMDTEASVTVAMLHDVVGKGSMTLEDLRQAGFPEDVVEAVNLLTQDPATPFLDYIENLRKDPLATKVKLADLRHNADLSRSDIIDGETRQQEERCRQAIQILERK
ncbi:MAG TPA: GTP pyrophosphokinase [Firmicutes bacterium]|nr:GTP pyrophosphokinase [Bacillota bacterium]